MSLNNKLLVFFLLSSLMISAQQYENSLATQKNKKWYDKISFSGYMQVRYNKLLETNASLKCEQCDETWGGEGGGLSLRRLRFKFYGQISPRMYIYIQPDFAKSVN